MLLIFCALKVQVVYEETSWVAKVVLNKFPAASHRRLINNTGLPIDMNLAAPPTQPLSIPVKSSSP